MTIGSKAKARRAIRFVFPPSLGLVQANVRAELLSKVLSVRLSRPVLLEVAKSYDQLERRVLRGEVDVAWAPPALCDKARAWPQPILRAVRAGATSYRAAFVGRCSDALRIDQLQGRRAAWIAPTSTAGYLLAVAHLRSLGFDPDRLLGAQCFLGSYREAIVAVKRGAADFTSLYTSGADEASVLTTLVELTGAEESRLVPFAYTHPSRTDGIILSPELPADDTANIVNLFLQLDEAEAGTIGILQLFNAQRFEIEPEGSPKPATDTVPSLTPAAPLQTALVRQDVSDARCIEKELFHLASYPLLTPFPQLEVEPRGEVLFANPAARRAFPDLFESSADHPIVRAALELAKEEEGDASYGSSDLRPPREVTIGERTFEIMASRAPELGRIRVFISDISERKRIEAQLIRAERLASMGTLAAGVGHEINNPLAYVIENLEFVRQRMLVLEANAGRGVSALSTSGLNDELSEVLDALAGAAEGAERIRIVVHDLRNLCRADETTRESIDVRQVLQSVTAMLKNEIRFRGQLERELGPVPLVDASPARLGQVFMNLIQNAAHALPEGDADQNFIRLVTRTDSAGRAVVEVQDSGAGMSPEVQARIFEPFFTTKPAGIGTGLGLSISQAIVASLGGEITVKSEPGRGSTIAVILPAAAARQAKTTKSCTAKAPDAASRRVLVVDDEPAVTRSIRRMLCGHEIVEVGGGQAALEILLKDDRFDVVLCDLMMPQTTGMDVYDALREARPAIAERMVFMTGGAFTPRASEFLKRVKNPRIEKPFLTEALRALIEEAAARNSRT